MTTCSFRQRALTSTTEIKDAGILVAKAPLEAIGPPLGMTLPQEPSENPPHRQTAFPVYRRNIHGAGGHPTSWKERTDALRSSRKVSE